jgi:Rrf2 family protein
MKLISDAAEYALRAVVWMAQRPGEAQKVRQIAQGTRAAPGYLVKVLKSLCKAGIVSAQRGSLGGFTLQRDPRRLTVLDVLNAVDPVERIARCPLGIASHGRQLCPMHRRIDDAIASIEVSFSHSTIQDLIDEPSASRPLCETPDCVSACASRHESKSCPSGVGHEPCH